MTKRSVDDVIKDIIELGNRLDWFIPFIAGNDIENYIHKSFNKIYDISIDPGCLKLYRDNSQYTESELWIYLVEVINKAIPDAKYYSIEEDSLPF